MRWIKEFIKSVKTDNTVILKEDIEENMYFFAVSQVDFKYKLINRTLLDVNKILFNKYGDLMDKKFKKELIDEITLFIERICRNYDFFPTEEKYNYEFNHFIKSMIK